MQQTIDVNVGIIPSQAVETQASELELERNQKQAAKVIAKKKGTNLIVNIMLNSAIQIFFLYDNIFEFNCNGTYLEALYETRCGYYDR